MKSKLTQISEIEDENQKLKQKIKCLESKLEIQEEEHQKFKKTSENIIRNLNEKFRKFMIQKIYSPR